MKIVTILACLAISLSGCANIAAGVTNIAATVAGSTPQQATTLAQAIQIADLVTKATDVAVNTGKLSRATLEEINALNDGVHAAIVNLEAANASGQSLNFAAFNAALQAFNAYTTANAVAH
jgi:hypothetical protein